MGATAPSAVPSGNPGSYILDDLDTDDMGIPGSAMPAGSNSTLTTGFPGASKVVTKAASVGGTSQDEISGMGSFPSRPKVIITKRNPFTGKLENVQLDILYTNNKKGETIFRQSTTPSGGLSIDLGDLFKE